jgi:hypothetical protein
VSEIPARTAVRTLSSNTVETFLDHTIVPRETWTLTWVRKLHHTCGGKLVFCLDEQSFTEREQFIAIVATIAVMCNGDRNR